MSEEKSKPNSIYSSDKDVKAPNVFERVKEEFEAVLHGETHSHHHHKETHGLRKDIDENTPISDVKAPNVFERAKEEIEALVQAIHPKKEGHSHASTSDGDNRTNGATAELKTHNPDSLSENKAKVPNQNERVEEATGAHLPGQKSLHRHHKETHGRSDDIDDNIPTSEVKVHKDTMSNAKDNFNVADLSAALNAGDRADLVNVLKNKLQDLTGKHTNLLENLSPNVRKRVEVLRDIQSQHDELEAKFFEERAALEAKYQKLYQPLYSKRFDIVNGVVEVDGAVTEAAAAAADQEEDKDAVEKGVPDFWFNAMKNNDVLAEEITERDEGALKFLQDIKWARIDNPKGFKLEFFFDTNPYFKNTVLTKTYHMIDEDEPILEKAIGTEIEWYPGKCLTQKILKKKPKKGSKNAKPIIKTEQCESFFNFFSPPQVPEEEEDIDEEAAEELQSLMEQDYDIG
ncbi:Nucleosome assembly protein 1;2, partial [Datura stramonium]|nr:Nucleosome assembly protein 1;2 [Datura stramonium]